MQIIFFFWNFANRTQMWIVAIVYYKFFQRTAALTDFTGQSCVRLPNHNSPATTLPEYLLIPVFLRCYPKSLFKYPVKIRYIIKPSIYGNIYNLLFRLD